MTSKIHRQRTAKAHRRKDALAARRRAANGNSAQPLAQGVRRAAVEPIQRCMIPGNLFEQGMGPVLLARGEPGADLAVAVFLVDAFCLGVKDTLFRSVPAWRLKSMVEHVSAASPMVEVAPSHARKLLRDAVRYAAELGLGPPRNFAAIEPLFGDVRAEDCDLIFTFGRDGKPFYIAGPSESPAQIAAHLSHLRRRLGDKGFKFIVPLIAAEDMEAAIEAPAIS